MHPVRFTVLYLLCLGFCLGVLKSLESRAEAAEVPEEEIAQVDGVMAVPPRPEGARDQQAASGEGYLFTEQGCLELEDQSRDLCFQQLGRQRAGTDLDGGILACEKIQAKRIQNECLADVAEQYATTDREAALAVCPTIKNGKWRDQCVFGVALALRPIDPDGALALCYESGRWVDYCRHDVNGEIAQVDLDHALRNCNRLEGDILRQKTCYHGIGKYVGRISTEEGFAACQRVDLGPQNLFRENCVHGVGWAGAEQMAEKFAADCSRAGDQQDSCLLGVAYNLKRHKPLVGIEICDSVERNDLRSDCLAFLNR